MLSRDQQRDILAIGLVALSFFLLLTLVPTSLFGEWGARWFPGGNLMGRVGGLAEAGMTFVLGAAAAFLPVLIFVGGLRAGGWLSPSMSARALILCGGLTLLLPLFLHVAGAEIGVTGRVGAALGSPLDRALGWLGTSFLLATALSILLAATLGWNSLRSGVRLGRWIGKRGRRAIAGAKRGRKGAPKAKPRKRRAPSGESSGAASAPAEEEADSAEAVAPRSRRVSDAGPESGAEPASTKEEGREELPPLHLLTSDEGRDLQGTERELDRLGEVLLEKLRSFNVRSEIGGRTTGPVVTQFEVIPAPGVKVNRISNLDADLALAMKARSIRIVAPIPGKGAVGVEIPNPRSEVVHLRDILESSEFRDRRNVLPLALGKNLTGHPAVSDLARMPHVLIAGATGSGKSVCLNAFITSLVYRHTPESLRLLLIDPKMVELSAYADLPHLRHPVVTDPRDAAGALKWAVLEMERRYALLSENGVRSLAEFNRRVREGSPLRRTEPRGPEDDPDRWLYAEGPLPFVVVVVDELADLMMTVQSEIERPLTHLAQKARAIGIHLIVATQRPSVNVITGLIKANFPTRIAFRVASKTDSRTILDQNGADALLGNGDMLFLPPGRSEPARIQGGYIPTEDTDRLMGWYREREEAGDETADSGEPKAGADPAEADILEVVRSRELEEAAEAAREEGGPGDWDELFRAAGEVCIQHDQGSTSLLQRKLRIGYGRAARIVDQLHTAGVLGPPDGSKPREVLMGLDELDALAWKGGDD